MIGFAVVGCGYWGPNLIRVLSDLPGARLAAVCDLDASRLDRLRGRYPTVTFTQVYDDILRDPEIAAIAIATPVRTHFQLALAALLAGKHVLVEKPLACSSPESERLVEEAAKRGLTLAVDHTFIYTPAVQKMQQLVSDGIGDVYYYDSVRVNLGLFQNDVSVIWDLAVHDLAIMDYVLPGKPVAVSAVGATHISGEPANIAYISLFYPNNLIAHVHVNWLAPVKVRRTLIGGSRKMIVYDDLEPSEKIKVYDKGITLDHGGSSRSDRVYEAMVGYRSGDMWAPHLEVTEALRTELQEFVNSIVAGTAPVSDGRCGARIVRILEAASVSFNERGRVVDLHPLRQVA